MRYINKGKHVFNHATAGSAGYDLYPDISEPVTIEPGQTVLIGTGIYLEQADTGMAFIVMPRSGMGAKQGIVLGNTLGLIDSDYNQEILVSVLNRNHDKAITVVPDKAFAQGIFVPILHPELEKVDSFDAPTDRGSFGSTDKA